MAGVQLAPSPFSPHRHPRAAPTSGNKARRACAAQIGRFLSLLNGSRPRAWWRPLQDGRRDGDADRRFQTVGAALGAALAAQRAVRPGPWLRPAGPLPVRMALRARGNASARKGTPSPLLFNRLAGASTSDGAGGRVLFHRGNTNSSPSRTCHLSHIHARPGRVSAARP